MKKSFYGLIFILLVAACNTSNPIDYSAKIVEIQKKIIPDKRLEYWNIKVDNKGKKQILTGATISKKAFSELKNFATKNSLDFKVELLPAGKFRKNPWAIVTLSVCNIRSSSNNAAELITQALLGTPVKVYKKENGWYLIQTPDRYFGWVGSSAISLKTNAEMKDWKLKNKVIYAEQNGFAYTRANDKSTIEFDLVLADLLTVVASEKNYYKVVLADGREGFVRKDECTSLKIWKKKSIAPKELLESAYKFKGIPYLWGGASAKMSDCSGFVKTSYYYHGIILQRDASQQALYGESVDTQKNYTQLQPGDLVFFGRKATTNKKERITHVGMCIGNQDFIHESGFVHLNSLNKDSDFYNKYYEKRFVRARRIIGNIDGVGIQWIVDNEFYKQVLSN